MKFKVNLEIKPPIGASHEHNDQWEAVSWAKALKRFNLANKNICDLKHHGMTTWVDHNRAVHVLKIKEA